MGSLNYIFENNAKWIADKLKVDSEYFNKLISGQHPRFLYIGCSDSRVTAEEIMGLGPGELFVHRNIANLINTIDLNVLSVIEYAVEHLKVQDIIVCGHYSCGGIKAAMENENLGILNPWLKNIRDVYRIHKEKLNSIADPEKKYDKLVELNVQEQCINLIKIHSVQKAIKGRDLKIHGWVFDLHNGQLVDLNIDLPNILNNLADIYRLIKEFNPSLD